LKITENLANKSDLLFFVEVTLRLDVWLVTVILATQEAEIRRIKIQGQLGQKVSEISSQSIKNWSWWYACHTSYSGSTNRRIMV
jgi:hypothetical protein